VQNALERRPATRQVGVQGFEVGIGFGGWRIALADGTEASTVEGRRHRHADQIQDGRHQIDETRRRPRGRRRQRSLRPEDQRHTQCHVVGEESVRTLTVLAERLSVIRRDDDERVVERARRPQAVEETAEDSVRVGNLARVRIGCVTSSKWFRRGVRLVGIVQVDPSEPGCRLVG
jgi:hypothetical protein